VVLGLPEHVMAGVLEKRPYAQLFVVRQDSFFPTVYDVFKTIEIDLVLNISFLFLWCLLSYRLLLRMGNFSP